MREIVLSEQTALNEAWTASRPFPMGLSLMISNRGCSAIADGRRELEKQEDARPWRALQPCHGTELVSRVCCVGYPDQINPRQPDEWRGNTRPGARSQLQLSLRCIRAMTYATSPCEQSGTRNDDIGLCVLCAILDASRSGLGPNRALHSPGEEFPTQDAPHPLTTAIYSLGALDLPICSSTVSI